MWDRQENQLALLELVATGQLRRRRGQAEAWAWLAELSWTRHTGRRNEIALQKAHAPAATRLLDQVWPGWDQALAQLQAEDLPPSEHGWRRLQDIRRHRDAVGLPPRLNRRTGLAHVGVHSKAAVSRHLRPSLADTHLTHDGVARLRPSRGLRLANKHQEFDAHAIAGLLGEVILTERALCGGTAIKGALPRFILTVENLGPYLDTPLPADCLAAHVPGWDTRTIRLVLERLPTVPLVHFGDLDPNGLRIFRHLRQLRPEARWFVPHFWSDYIPTRGLDATWPADLYLADTPAIVRNLAQRGIWLEQETITLDPRLPEALASLEVSTEDDHTSA